MNEITPIYTTVSEGRLHIAVGTNYVGSVDSYNNCFTQFFAWAFGFSMAVNFDGKIRSVNKESYTNLVLSLSQNNKINNICDRSIFRSVAETATLPTTNLRMRDVISAEDRKTLFQKLSIAISKGDTTKALLMIGKGAELDTPYYDRNNLPPSFFSDTADLSLKSRYNITVFHAPPILQAARKGNEVVCKFLKEAGANSSSIGEEYSFKREIIKVHNSPEYGWVPVSVPHYHHTTDAKGDPCVEIVYKVEYQYQLRDRVIVTTQDSRSSKKIYRLDQSNLLER